MPCLLKTLIPLIVILQKAMHNAGFSKEEILSALKGTQVIKGGGTLNCGEKKAQVEVLFSSGMGIVHPAYLKASLPDGSFVCLYISDHLGGKILIEGVVDYPILVESIGLKPSSKSGILVLLPLKSFLGVPISVRI